jgi:membrane protein YdbS with pleckstrin-like domain
MALMPGPVEWDSDGERIEMSLRTHKKALILPAVVLVLLTGIASYLTAVVTAGDDEVVTWVAGAIWLAAAAAIFAWSVLPFLRWLTTVYMVTTERVLHTTGLLTRTGRSMALTRVVDVSFDKHPLDRMLGCGTVVIRDASGQTGMQLRDVPRVDSVYQRLTDLVMQARDDGGGMPEQR